MWTIGCADRLRFPRFPSSSESGEMLAFARIPTGPTTNQQIVTKHFVELCDTTLASREGKHSCSTTAIGRSEDPDNPWNPLMHRHHVLVWDRVRATHLGQRSTDRAPRPDI